MRYDSLFNSKKWPSDSSKGLVTPAFWPSHSVRLLYVLPNYPFSNLDCSGLEWENFLKFDLFVSKWPKLKKTEPKVVKWLLISYTLDHLNLRVFIWPFESCRHWPNKFYILVWHSVTSYGISGYYTLIWKGYLGLSCESNCLSIPGLVSSEN